jgi:F-type H+-transporting ATPase subunit alpha
VTTRGEDIVSIIKQQIEQFGTAVTMVDVGSVIEVGDGIARIHGLASAKYNELLQFPNDIIGIAMNLEEDSVSAIILGDYAQIKEGDEVRCTGRIAEVPVGEALIGRVVDPLGRPQDGRGAVKADKTRPIERVAPNVVLRASVDTPVQTGIKAVDSMFPIGRGQRELIIGDRSTGKTAISLDTIVNQKGGDLICIYVAIGQKVSQVARVVATLANHGAMEHTIIVTASASDSVALQYLAPYAGCAMGEEFMEQGKDVLIIYDDLSKHAWAYRQLSLLLRRPPGREAYPGDVFYLHSRLLERAAKYAKEYGGGSLTALPIIETQAGDVSAYIPTNVISITDGQLYLESDLFNAGIKPALNVGISVSRVGSKAQTAAMKQVAGRLKLDMGQFREVAAFAQFGTAELDKATQAQLERGQRITEVLKQPQFAPVPLEKQVMILYAVINGYMDDVPMDKVTAFEADFHRHMETNHKDLGESIAKTKELDDKSEAALKKAIEGFKKDFYSGDVIKTVDEKKDTVEAKEESAVSDEKKGEAETDKGGKKESKSKK